MAQYINKSALVAEIERRNAICKKVALDLRTQENKDYYQGKAEAYKEVLDILDTPEVKEVDLEKEAQECWDYVFALGWDENSFMTMNHKEFLAFAKHFFELGLSVSNSAKVAIPDIDDVLKENGVNPYSKEVKIIKESYFMAIEKLAQKGE